MLNVKDLGLMNSWFPTNKESQEKIDKVNDCFDKKHNITKIELSNCYNQYICDVCGITWKVDSSD